MTKKRPYIDITETLTGSFFSNAPNPMCITKADDGTFVKINKAFTSYSGLKPKDIIGKTTLQTGQITPETRSMVLNEIKTKGYVENFEMQIRDKNNEQRRLLINTFPIRDGRNNLLLTTVTDVSKIVLGSEEQEYILFKSLSAIKGTGVILIKGPLPLEDIKDNPNVLINETARKALRRQPLTKLLGTLGGRKSVYFTTATGCYSVKAVSFNYNYPMKIIMMEPVSNSVCIREKLKQNDLYPREKETAYLVAMGYSNKEIAESLCISEHTVKDYVKNIFRKLGIKKRSELCSQILGL